MFPQPGSTGHRQLQRAEYVGLVGAGNLGDELVFRATSEIFGRHYAIEAPGLKQKKASLFQPSKEVVLLGGGTLIKKDRKAWLGRVKAALRRSPNAKLVVFGTGVADEKLWGSFGVETDCQGWVDILERASYLGVRGFLSKEHLQRWGLLREVEVIGDPALWFALDSVVPKFHAKRIGLNFGTSQGRIFGQDEDAVLEFAGMLIRHYCREGWEVTLFPVIQRDIEYLREAVRRAGASRISMHENFLDQRATLQALAEQQVFVGEKLHSVVLALCAYTPAIMIAYRTKCLDFMQSVNRSEWTFRTDELELDAVISAVEQVCANTDDQQAQIYESLRHWKNRLLGAAQLITGSVETK